jgi:hypothetical protein
MSDLGSTSTSTLTLPRSAARSAALRPSSRRESASQPSSFSTVHSTSNSAPSGSRHPAVPAGQSHSHRSSASIGERVREGTGRSSQPGRTGHSSNSAAAPRPDRMTATTLSTIRSRSPGMRSSSPSGRRASPSIR